MAISWDEFPHNEIRLKIYARIARNAAARSVEGSLRHILQRRLPSLRAEDHRRFVELEASSLVEHLRCTRDIYQEFVNKHNCHPVLEAHWVVLRCAVFPTSIALLREQVIKYATLTRIPGRDLSILFGIPTRTCYKDPGDRFAFLCPPDPDDGTPATDAELQSLGRLVHDYSLLWFRDIRDGGSVWHPYGGGPFATDDRRSIENSWSLCSLPQQITFIDWMGIRKKWWHRCSPWTDGLVSLFGCVQEELLAQWRALPRDSLAHEIALKQLEEIVVPAQARRTFDPNAEMLTFRRLPGGGMRVRTPFSKDALLNTSDELVECLEDVRVLVRKEKTICASNLADRFAGTVLGSAAAPSHWDEWRDGFAKDLTAKNAALVLLSDTTALRPSSLKTRLSKARTGRKFQETVKK
jgi:hypothetical protein